MPLFTLKGKERNNEPPKSNGIGCPQLNTCSHDSLEQLSFFWHLLASFRRSEKNIYLPFLPHNHWASLLPFQEFSRKSNASTWGKKKSLLRWHSAEVFGWCHLVKTSDPKHPDHEWDRFTFFSLYGEPVWGHPRNRSLHIMFLSKFAPQLLSQSEICPKGWKVPHIAWTWESEVNSQLH